MDPHSAAAEPAAPALLGVPEQPSVVCTAVPSNLAPDDLMQSDGRRQSGEPGAGKLHAGFYGGDEYKGQSWLGEGTGAKVPATARLRKSYRFEARLYLPPSQPR